MKRYNFVITVTIICFCFLFLSISVIEAEQTTISQEIPIIADLAKFDLEIVNTEVINEITTYSMITMTFDRSTITAKEGYKLVVVTLTGKLAEPCAIFLHKAAITAIYEEKGLSDKKVVKLEYPVAYDYSGDGIWSDLTTNINSTVTAWTVAWTLSKPGSITLKVAFILPEKISNFSVLVPTLAKGEAVILSKSTKKE